MKIIFFGLAGLISGVVAGMGMGGGTLLIPILSIFLNVEQRSAQGINLIVFVPMSLVALIIHCKNGLVDFKIGIPIMLSGILTSIGGSLLAMKLSNDILRKFFGGFLLLIGIWQIVSLFFPKKSKDNTPQFKIVGGFKIR